MTVSEQAEVSAPLDINIAEEPIEFSGSMSLLIDAASAFGVDLDEQEREDWLLMARSVHIIDQFLDEERTDIMPYVAAMLSGDRISGIPDAFQDKCREYMERQSDLRRDDIVRKLGKVGALVEQQASTDSVYELIKIRRQEADLMANLLALPTYAKPDETERATFNNWLISMSHTGYLVDSFKDLKDDYINESSGVKPTIHSRFVLGTIAAKQALDSVSKTPKKVIGRVIRVGVKNQIYGKKPDFANPNQQI